MSEKKYSIQNMNGFTGESAAEFSYGDQNRKTKTGEGYGLSNMNALSEKDDVHFELLNMNGESQ